MPVNVSSADPLNIRIGNGVTVDPVSNTNGKVQVSPALVAGQRTLVLILAGQSNQGSHNLETYAPASPLIHNFNYLSGGMYAASNPLVGCSSAPGCGHHALRTADKLIAAGKTDRVILAPMAIGATFTADWAAGGLLGYLPAVMRKRLAMAGLMPPAVTMFVLQNLGERDATTLGQVPPAVGTANRQSIIAEFRAAGLTCPFFEALCSFNGGPSDAPGKADVRAAQAAVVNGVDVFQGADTDSLMLVADRNNAHFTASGSDKHAQLWANILSTHL